MWFPIQNKNYAPSLIRYHALIIVTTSYIALSTRHGKTKQYVIISNDIPIPIRVYTRERYDLHMFMGLVRTSTNAIRLLGIK